MQTALRGVRNAFRNLIRTFSIVTILGLSVGLALAMLIANQAVKDKIESVKSSVGNTVSISPAGARGFEGGGNALTETQLAKVTSLTHVTQLTESLSDRLTTSDTSLQSAVDAGSLGQRFSQNNGTDFSGGNAPQMPQDDSSSSSSSGTSVTRTFTPPVTVVGTTDPSSALSSSQGGGTFTLKSGKVFASNSSDNVAVIGKALATKNSLKVGSTFTAYSTTITVIGIYDSGNTFSNNQVIMPLKTVQTLSGQAGAVTSAVATVDSVTNVKAVTSKIESTLGSSTADVTNSVDTAETAVSSLENIKTISLYSLIGAVVAGAVIILLTMIMIVRERRREIGVLKAIGASNIKVMGQFMAEAVTLTVLAAVIGIILGAVAAKPITNMLVSSNTTSSSTSAQAGPGAGGPGTTASSSTSQRPSGFSRGARNFASSTVSNVTANVGWNIIGYGLGVGIIIALAGSALASFFIAKVRPAEVMRAE